MLLTPLLITLAYADEEIPPLMVVHLDPAASYSLPGGAWRGELGAKVEFPLIIEAAWVATALIGVITGVPGSVDRALTRLPPISPQYVGFVSRGIAGDDWAGGGGIGLRVRPLAQVPDLPSAARGLWFDVDGRYSTRGWGVDTNLGWDFALGRVVAVGPTVGYIWEGGAGRVVGAISFSFSLDVERLGGGGRIELPTSETRPNGGSEPIFLRP